MNFLSCMTMSETDVYILFGIILVLVLVFWLARKYFGSQGEFEAADPEKLMDNIMSYRDACMNDLTNYILYKYNVGPEDAEKCISAYQSELQQIVVKIVIGDLVYTVTADYDDGCYVLVGQAVLSNGDIICREEKIRIQRGYMVDYIKVQTFLNEMDSAMGQWEDKHINQIMTDVSQIVNAPELAELSPEALETILFSGVSELSDLLQERKFRNQTFIAAYSKIMTYIVHSGRTKEFIKYLTGVEEEVEEVEENEEV